MNDIQPYTARHSVSDYRVAATECFGKVRLLFRWSTNFWRLGHAFDTAIDYFDVIKDTSAAVAFGQDALNAFQDTSGHWYDDFGWWGLSAGRAARRADWFGPVNAKKFESVRDKCWKFMDQGDPGDMNVDCCSARQHSNDDDIAMQGAPSVYTLAIKKELPGGLCASLKPKVPGGVWNCDWSYTKTSYEDPRLKCLEPCYCLPIWDGRQYAKDGLGGFQNTVTNALYLSLASRMSAVEQAKAEYGFFDTWFKNSSEKTDSGIACSWKVGNDVVGFVRERVPAYADGSSPWAYHSMMAWAGDQGLLIAAFADYLKINGSSRSLLSDRCRAMARGTMLYIADRSKNPDGPGLLRDWFDKDSPNNDPPGFDADDYHTGSGVFWRSVKYVYDTDKTLLNIPTITGFKDFLAYNADAACDANTGKTIPEHMRDPNVALVTFTNDLATLLTAIRILGNP